MNSIGEKYSHLTPSRQEKITSGWKDDKEETISLTIISGLVGE